MVHYCTCTFCTTVCSQWFYFVLFSHLEVRSYFSILTGYFNLGDSPSQLVQFVLQTAQSNTGISHINFYFNFLTRIVCYHFRTRLIKTIFWGKTFSIKRNFIHKTQIRDFWLRIKEYLPQILMSEIFDIR